MTNTTAEEIKIMLENEELVQDQRHFRYGVFVREVCMDCDSCSKQQSKKGQMLCAKKDPKFPTRIPLKSENANFMGFEFCDRKEFLAAPIQRQLAQNRHDCRKAIPQKYLTGKTPEEIATELNITLGYVFQCLWLEAKINGINSIVKPKTMISVPNPSNLAEIEHFIQSQMIMFDCSKINEPNMNYVLFQGESHRYEATTLDELKKMCPFDVKLSISASTKFRVKILIWVWKTATSN